jgi:hypothetical protein
VISSNYSRAPLPLLTCCNGKRNLAEVIRLMSFEHGPMDFDFVGYFKFLAQYGYVDLAATPPEVPAGAEPGRRRKAAREIHGPAHDPKSGRSSLTSLVQGIAIL